VDFFIASFIYIAMMFYYGIFPGLSGVLLFLPMLLLSVATVLGVGCFAAALNVRYRDIGQALPFIIQTLLFLTPVIYPVSLVPSDLKWLLFINPMTGVIETMRSTLIGGGGVEVGYLSISVVSALIMLWVGVKFFKRQEKVFADLV
jgi:lipopolysaccharide transport system permease protein